MATEDTCLRHLRVRRQEGFSVASVSGMTKRITSESFLKSEEHQQFPVINVHLFWPPYTKYVKH